MKEGTPAALLQSGWHDIWWAEAMACYCSLWNFTDKIADKEVRMSSSLESRPPLLGIQLKDFSHLTNGNVVGSTFVKFQFAHEATLLTVLASCFS